MTSDAAALRAIEQFSGAMVDGRNLAVGEFVRSDQGLLLNQRVRGRGVEGQCDGVYKRPRGYRGGACAGQHRGCIRVKALGAVLLFLFSFSGAH